MSELPSGWLAKRILYWVRLPAQVLIHPALIFFCSANFSMVSIKSCHGNNRIAKHVMLGIVVFDLQDWRNKLIVITNNSKSIFVFNLF
jgi:hypothetical protein